MLADDTPSLALGMNVSGQSIHLKTFHSLDTRMLGQTEMGKEWLFRELKAAQDKLFLGCGPATGQPLQYPRPRQVVRLVEGLGEGTVLSGNFNSDSKEKEMTKRGAVTRSG